MGKKIGITSTVPVEILLAADYQAIDLNNIFINSRNPSSYIEKAERDGFPKTYCSWIKGIYSASVKNSINEVVAVLEGDCSNTHALMEVLKLRKAYVIPFAFPFSRDEKDLKFQLERFMERMGTNIRKVSKIRNELVPLRKKLKEIDYLTYSTCQVTGEENHTYLISSSDFKGDAGNFEKELDDFLYLAKKREKKKIKTRLGFIGVPPIFTDLYSFISRRGAEVVFNETQRQFSMPCFESDMTTQYLSYTYPYDVFGRIEDIKKAIRERKLNGIIHYVQSFCYRQLADLIFRRKLKIPLLTLEGEQPGLLDARTKVRIEAFLEMLNEK
ncbi:MAG: 2-hydroxyacyl-CoA dehydratase [Candidatus Coatesbacteria bacterium]|nr:2-hydroxyacyl-CoA dehydratase [Candidatus Coatesbacteria bacterium]